MFKKKACCICGNEVGLIGNRKLADGNMCSKCAKKLSPWFEDRRESTMEQIKAQLAYREQNAKDLESFTVSRILGESNKMYIEEVNGVPTRFFVTGYSDYMEVNPDIISFKDVISCVTDVEIRDEEMKKQDDEGKMVSYDPPRYKHHHNFYIKMDIRNNPYFNDIKFRVNSGVVTLESVGGMGGFFGSNQRPAFGRTTVTAAPGNSFTNTRERSRLSEYQQMCEKIEQAVEDGKRGGYAPAAQTAGAEAILMMIGQIKNAPDLLAAVTLAAEVARQATTLPDQDWERIKTLNDMALAEAKLRFGNQEPTSVSVQEAPKPKFCPNCGAPYEGGKFCQSCGTKL